MAINGAASNLFISTKGLKQGDPMSPFLFILVVEVLSLMMKRVASLNLIYGFKPSAEADFEINHLQFADDLIVFLDDNCEQVNNLKNVLLGFELVSGLKVNFQKSALVPVGDAVNASDGAVIFGCSITSFPMKYLGIPLGSKSKAVGVWDTILQNFEKKLSMWDHVEKNMNIQVQSGDRCLFWKDMWMNGESLKSMFPNLFKLSKLQDATIQEMLDISAGNCWNLAFCRSLKDAEIEDISHLLDLLSTFNSGVGDDQRVWQNGAKTFSVAECYKSLEDDGLLVFPYKCVWNSKIPQKVAFFVWTLCYNAAPTMDSLRNTINVNGCLLCKKSAETSQHLFPHCEITTEMWNHFLKGYNLNWMFQENVRKTI
ncbi:uncharacterized protein LOC113305513 [Papaver somniferum]|uniref:uncharacterized protein LOC113305513 n=1 Tax=Papaver somniferum TaxID=3469 RepID=UPI000E701C78|nr:uncharacterized protein LOC113305513 [Papaver somniferum]